VLGSLGTIDSATGAQKDVVSLTRSGTLSVYSPPASACSPSSWPSFHHDIANSGDYSRDAIAPGKPLGASVAGNILSWTAPGGDLMCPTASTYEIVTSGSPITPQNFAAATPLSGAPSPAAAGTAQKLHAAGQRSPLRGDPRDRRAGQHRPAGGRQAQLNRRASRRTPLLAAPRRRGR
jgi:hypothetical protein